jgi:hypothetical protein
MYTYLTLITKFQLKIKYFVYLCFIWSESKDLINTVYKSMHLIKETVNGVSVRLIENDC